MPIELSLAEGWLPERPQDVPWEMATLLPEQGNWTVEQYLTATEASNRRVELVDGRLEFLPMPTEAHQALAGYLYQALLAFNALVKRGHVPFPPIRLRVSAERVREPDVLFLLSDHAHLRHNRAWDGADLVMEVVSETEKDRHRDYREKLTDYARVGVAEYWIVDPAERAVTVLSLEKETLVPVRRYVEGESAGSLLLNGFAVNLTDLFAVADEVPE